MELYADAEIDPVIDVGVSHALLERAARSGIGSLRLWRPLRPALSVGRLDCRDPRSASLAGLARAADVTIVKRLAGGRAATLDEGCLCLGWALPSARAEQSSARYRRIVNVILAALGELDVECRLGEAEGEWCPGGWSVQGPNGKLAGLAQRHASGAAWCEALFIVERGPSLQLLSKRVHELLCIPWRQDAQGELAKALPGEPDLHGKLSDALLRALKAEWPALQQRPLPSATRERAFVLGDEHRWR